MRKLSIRNMTVKNKLVTFSAIALVMILILAVSSIVVLTQTNNARANRYVVYGDAELALSDAYTYYNQMRTSVRDSIFIYADDQAKRQEKFKEIDEEYAKIQTKMAYVEKYLDQYTTDSIKEYYQKVQGNITTFEASVQVIGEFLEAGDAAGAEQELLANGVTASANLEGNFTKLMDDLIAEADANAIVIDNEVHVLTVVLIVICVIAFIIVAALCLSIIKQIATPIAKLSEASKKMALGDVDVDCEKVNNDDLGVLMDEFGEMAAATREQVRVADIISKGDMTVQVSPRSDKDVLGQAFQRMLADNNRTLGNIKESTKQVTIGAEQVASASQSLAQGSTEQASALQEVTASVAEIAERTKANAAQASEADDLVRNVKETASEGNDQMKSMIGAMNDINQSSETISKIIKTIDDIAFQTNILALNAAVEAARAGVHGKGFAVVAEEVRNLAAKSASAASETAEMIEDSIHKVSNGTKLAEETAKSLNDIVEAIDKIVELIGNIAVASNNQATAVSQIDQAISQVSTVVQTNSATSEQCAAASEELSNQAATLRELLANYKLITGNQNSFAPVSQPSASYDDSSNSNEQIISLDGEFGKY